VSWNEWVATAFLVLGAFFALTGGFGIIRFPDFYTRLHPAGKNDTLGQLLLLAGLAFLIHDWSEDWIVGAKLLLATTFIFLTAPTATYAITKAAWSEGLRPWGVEEEGGAPEADPPPAEGPPSGAGPAAERGDG